jgi:hypothetical protein
MLFIFAFIPSAGVIKSYAHKDKCKKQLAGKKRKEEKATAEIGTNVRVFVCCCLHPYSP